MAEGIIWIYMSESIYCFTMTKEKWVRLGKGEKCVGAEERKTVGGVRENEGTNRVSILTPTLCYPYGYLAQFVSHHNSISTLWFTVWETCNLEIA